MYHRSRRRRPEEPLDLDKEPLEVDTTLMVPEPSPEERFVNREEIEIRLSKLPPVCRQLFRLRFFYGFNAKEVAELMGRKVSNVYAATHRCTKLLDEVRTLPPPSGGRRREKRWER
jgi:RNA polymerase sigma factor (sigma-70 family)